MLNFGIVLEGLKLGKCFSRVGWNGKDMCICLQKPDENSKMTLPYIFMVIPTYNPDGSRGIVNRVPWLASQSDMLSEDWYEVVLDAEGSRAIAN